jgi:hypothetical protein
MREPKPALTALAYKAPVLAAVMVDVKRSCKGVCGVTLDGVDAYTIAMVGLAYGTIEIGVSTFQLPIFERLKLRMRVEIMTRADKRERSGA